MLKELFDLGIDRLVESSMPPLPAQCKYSWKDIIFSYWSVMLCGGDCAEDMSANLKAAFHNSPLLNAPSPDRLLERLKELAVPSQHFKKNRSDVYNEFSINTHLNRLNLRLLKRTLPFTERQTVLDYDNTIISTGKSDAGRTYLHTYGYCPGVGIMGDRVVYVENRNGNCAPHTLQSETFERMFGLLESEGIRTDVFRADSASYQFDTVAIVAAHVGKFFIRAKVNAAVCDAIASIKEWKKVQVEGRTLYRGSVLFTPFKRAASIAKRKDLLREYRLVVTREERRDGQLNFFTGDACNYSPIMTNDLEMTDDEVVIFYNQRGKQEREFDILKNDFAWNRMPFSKLEQNTVFLLVMAMCRNIYSYLIKNLSKRFKNLSPKYRLKKFIFRFICVPARWVRGGRQKKLRVYSDMCFKT